jgi:hypothetical protein
LSQLIKPVKSTHHLQSNSFALSSPPSLSLSLPLLSPMFSLPHSLFSLCMRFIWDITDAEMSMLEMLLYPSCSSSNPRPTGEEGERQHERREVASRGRECEDMRGEREGVRDEDLIIISIIVSDVMSVVVIRVSVLNHDVVTIDCWYLSSF